MVDGAGYMDASASIDRGATMTDQGSAVLRLVGIEKAFGGFKILKRLDLEAIDGEFLSLLGPSGCGKTTTLRIVAGFERADAGKVLLDAKDIAPLPPNKRDVSTVFQDYSLFPHLTVAENVAFGLVERRMPKVEITARVQEMLEMVRLTNLAGRKPAQLSGGQKQRVALARSLAVRPKILLLDEPLGALDMKLRKDMQLELRSFQQRLGITFIYVTHDQEEALTMSDRIVIMKDGEVQQIGRPRDIYNLPQNRFVADFIGETTFLPCVFSRFDSTRDVAEVKAFGQAVFVKCAPTKPDFQPGSSCTLSIRPEKIRLTAERKSSDENVVPGVVEVVVFRGAVHEYGVRLEDGNLLRATTPASSVPALQGQRVMASWAAGDAVLLRD